MVMSRNWINVSPGDRAFNIRSNMCDYFRLGIEDGNDVWLEGRIVGTEFVFNGRLFLHNGEQGTVIDNFPKGPSPAGWSQRRKGDAEGYELLDDRGEVVFSYHVDDKTCVIDVNLYKADGSLAAHGGQDGLIVHVPAMIGQNGIVIG
ncbi:hypothetical protein OIU13_12725 [Brevundimonas sp. BT-123]|uniref:hypothetical protein n=1 Tax=Brevundimonas sp. BT-123 TaxID=2986928 RepID=UPI0022362709|nr:hypothetical protein [Brevundimonas sp. BT-123]MCW0047392.1 hypothetical protein [Brevundimonas sp. BT-123]